VLAAPAETSFRSQFDFHRRRAVGKNAATERADRCLDALSKPLQTAA
jgi:hypothetical protein